MSDTPLLCLCGEAIRPGANYCARCGREVRQLCPLCCEERRLTSGYVPYASPWCEVRGELLYACRRCGRWLPTDMTICPDPSCRGEVRETWPANTGRAPDGAGRTDGWRWPSEWDRQNPDYRAPVYAPWQADSTVYAAFVAHGRLYVWVGTSLIAPGVGPEGAPTIATSGAAPWKCWLGFDGEPGSDALPESRIALLGGGAIAAAQNDFVIGGLYPRRPAEALKLDLGRPIAQTASGGWWAGWSLKDGSPRLHYARVNAQWRNTSCRAVTLNGGANIAAAAPRRGGRMLMRDGVAWWISEEGSLWKLDCKTEMCERVTEPGTEARIGWCDDRGGAHLFKQGGDGIRVGLDPGSAGGMAREAPGGSGPVRDLFVSHDLLAVVGDEIVTLDVRTGYILGGGKYTGRWVAGALADAEPSAPDREPRLLMLTTDVEGSSLTALRPSSSGEEAVWRGLGVKASGLIVAGRRMYIVHESGVISIRPATAAATSEEQL